jgi:hypothetical protein
VFQMCVRGCTEASHYNKVLFMDCELRQAYQAYQEQLGEVNLIHQDAGDPVHSLVVVKLAKWVDDTSEE